MQFLYAAIRDAMVVRQCQSELVLPEPYLRERAVPFFQVVLRVIRMVVHPFFPPKDA